MTFVVTENCIKCKYMDCVEVCPVDCFHEGPNFLTIDPEECIDCGLCLSVCPVDAIYAERDLPDEEAAFPRVNAEFFGPAVTGWGLPGGADARHIASCDHPVVAGYPRSLAQGDK